ncbi:MAG: stage II sporulation protein P [Bacilli bacterium]|nr:stage II sporulation protein P [Bacilli bacterium]MDD4809479.1 stage II sporulation protein P [Bacilli bacterium]
MKKFKYPKKKIKLIILTLLIGLCFQLSYSILMNIKLFSSNEEFIKALIENSDYYLMYEKNDGVTKKIASFLTDVDINQPTTIINKVFYANTNKEKVESVSNHIDDHNPVIQKEPLVYIYNSHQLENYDGSDYEVYNITPNVMMASYILKEKLNDLGIPSIVEEGNIAEFIRINYWSHDYSYEASRYFIKEARNKYPSLKFFVDVHRDAVNKKDGTTNIDGLNCARILFVVGLEHKNYQLNLALANNMNKSVMTKYPTLSRGVLTKKGQGVNGIYNQDISPNMILLEIGGYQNTIDEVLNTIMIISPIIKEHIENETRNS